jgi:hypothetical protein
MIRYLLTCLVFYPLITYSQPDYELSGFRNILFGSSPAEVRSREPAPSLQSFSGWGIFALSFEGRFAGIKARIDYTFTDDKLIEGSYILEPGDDYRDIFQLCRKEISDEYGKPNSWAVADIKQDSIWKKINKFGLYEGPQLFWLFNKGFIALHSSKFKHKITVTVLFSSRESVGDYNAESLIEIKNP